MGVRLPNTPWKFSKVAGIPGKDREQQILQSGIVKRLGEISRLTREEVLASLGSRDDGLSPEEVEERLVRYGENEITQERPPA
ncbi:MAG: cation-transporting P-type ATPase [Methanomicrobiales archaeon]|nr:cation-transporting P-type ATPase [Methanomicrobiales archaeon]